MSDAPWHRYGNFEYQRRDGRWVGRRAFVPNPLQNLIEDGPMTAMLDALHPAPVKTITLGGYTYRSDDAERWVWTHGKFEGEPPSDVPVDELFAALDKIAALDGWDADDEGGD